MGLYNFIARNILAPAVDISRGSETIKCLKFLEKTQWWPREKIIELQSLRLQELIKYAYKYVPYYRRIFLERGINPESIHSVRDLSSLPVLTKSTIRENFKELNSTSFPENKRILLATGGSSGDPLQFYRTKQDQLSWGFAAAQRAWEWAGFSLGDRTVRINIIKAYRSKKHEISERLKRYLERVSYIDAKTISDETLPVYAEKIIKSQPEFIWGYPGAIEIIARYFKENNITGFRIRGIFTGGEKLFGYQRELFSEVFKCKTYSNYSSWEAHAIAAECGANTGYHINAENIIVEIVDDQGNIVPDGQEGQVLITNLHNYAMPFIRYKIGDLAVSSNEPCSCGRGLPLLSSLNGRVSDILYTVDGKKIPSIALPNSVLAKHGVIQFQYIQSDRQHLVIKLVMDGHYSEDHLDRLSIELVERYQAILGKEMKIKIEFVDHIDKSVSGKRNISINTIERME